jgi:hypothetical protein
MSTSSSSLSYWIFFAYSAHFESLTLYALSLTFESFENVDEARALLGLEGPAVFHDRKPVVRMSASGILHANVGEDEIKYFEMSPITRTNQGGSFWAETTFRRQRRTHILECWSCRDTL